MPGRRSTRRDHAHVVTEARLSRSEEISQRERRYLVMMGLRVVCFVIAVVAFLNHAGWYALIPAVGAITLPYFAVVVANSRATSAGSGFRPYEPRLPERYSGPPGGGPDDQASEGQPDGGTASDPQGGSA
ncbi:MAG TPA: DUF3099 domain-containing protein [Streptosporangiaceae bacterium]|nr:DUF3099 domain-containing protein [Streptosporangiaceae bacterium]